MTAQLRYQDFRDLGTLLFGPILAPFVMDVAKKIHASTEPWLFLSREGYFLSELVRYHYRNAYADAGVSRIAEVQVSRRLLYSLCLSDPSLLARTLNHPFEGTFSKFLLSRYQIEDLSFGAEFEVRLPQDAGLVEEILNNLLLRFPNVAVAATSRAAVFGDYMRALVSGNSFHCVDLGYSGSIQKILSALYKYESTGHYLLLNSKSFTKDIGELKATASGFLSETAEFGSGHFLIDASLVMESVLTAPYGPVNGIERDPNGNWRFLLGETGRAQDYFHILLAVIDGIKEFLSLAHRQGLSAAELVGALDLEKHYELQLTFNRTPAMRMIIDILDIDDVTSGNTFVAPFKYLPVLKNGGAI